MHIFVRAACIVRTGMLEQLQTSNPSDFGLDSFTVAQVSIWTPRGHPRTIDWNFDAIDIRS